MEEVIQRAELVAETKSTVLITGETGTGKELVARAIHDRSAQRDMPLIKVNCAAIPETLLESELFGHVRGAFTGATTTKKGKFALADGGTIFLDEIGTMSPTLQSKLLRVLQEREFEPLGVGADREGRRARHRRHQPRPAADGRRRQVPGGSLLPAERDPDRDPAAARAARRHPGAGRALRRRSTRSAPAGAIERIDDGVLAALQQYDWPGNVRELENTIERAVVLSPGPVITARAVSVLGAADAAGDRPAVAEAAAEHRVGRARDDPARARERRRRQEGRRRADGHQPARAVVLPREVPARIVGPALTRTVIDYPRRNMRSYRSARFALARAASTCGTGVAFSIQRKFLEA